MADALYMDIADVNADKAFTDLGLDSIVGVEWVREINATYRTNITATKVYDYATVRALAGLHTHTAAPSDTVSSVTTSSDTSVTATSAALRPHVSLSRLSEQTASSPITAAKTAPDCTSADTTRASTSAHTSAYTSA